MSLIVLPGPAGRLPRGPLRINRGNALGESITHCLPLQGDPGEIVTGARLTLGSGGSWGKDRIRDDVQSLRGSGSAACASVPIDLSPYTGATVSFWLWWDAYANDDDFALEYGATSATNNGFGINPNSTAPANGFLQISLASNPSSFNASRITRPSAATWHHYMVRFDRTTGTAAGCSIYVDGVAVTATQTVANNVADNFGSAALYLFSRSNTSLFGAGRMANLIIRGGYLCSAEDARQEYLNPWQIYEPEPLIFPVGTAGTSVGISGESASASTGTLGPAVAIALGGLAVTTAAGTVTPSAGITVALTGAEATAAAGSLGPEIAAALSGSAASASVGTVTPSAGTVVDLSGLATTASAGSVAPAVSVVLSGAAATVAVGEVSPQSGTVAALSGLAATASGGTLSAAVAVTLSGLSVTSAAGSVAVEGQAQALAISRLHRQSTGPRRPASLSTSRR